MDLDIETREKSFDMPLSDLGYLDTVSLPVRVQSMFRGLAKWIVQEGPGGLHQAEFMSMEGANGFYIHVEGHESAPHEAEVHFTGKLLDGTVFSSSREKDTLKFKLSNDDVMEGFRLAITTMHVGEKAVFTIPQALLVTKSGSPAKIPCNIPHNQTLRFDIELISIRTDIIGDKSIIKKIIKSGRGNKLPLHGDEVLVKYKACLADGASISKSEGVEFILAEGFFCPAFAYVVKTMKVGEEAIVIIKPEYGFGGKGRSPVGNETAVPPYATLYVNLQLISWKIVTHIGENRDIIKRRLYKGYEDHFPWFRQQPRNGAIVKVRLLGKLEDGTIFYHRGHSGDSPFEFTTDEEQVIYGLDEAVMTMKQGEVASFTIPPQHAFGVVGSNQYPLAAIPPNSVVTYEIELLSYENEEPSHTSHKFPDKTFIAPAQKKEHEGDVLFNSGKYLRAYRRYIRARQILVSGRFVDYLKKVFKGDGCTRKKLQRSEQPFVDVKEILVSLALKSAECAMQLQRYKQALDRYHEVLEYEPGNTKAVHMVAQSFPEPAVAIDSDAMHRGLEEELEELCLPGRPLGLSVSSNDKPDEEPSEDWIYVPPLPGQHQANASQAVSTAPTRSPVTMPEASPVSSVTANSENQSVDATRGTKKPSVLRSCFGSSSHLSNIN